MKKRSQKVINAAKHYIAMKKKNIKYTQLQAATKFGCHQPDVSKAVKSMMVNV